MPLKMIKLSGTVSCVTLDLEASFRDTGDRKYLLKADYTIYFTVELTI